MEKEKNKRKIMFIGALFVIVITFTLLFVIRGSYALEDVYINAQDVEVNSFEAVIAADEEIVYFGNNTYAKLTTMKDETTGYKIRVLLKYDNTKEDKKVVITYDKAIKVLDNGAKNSDITKYLSSFSESSYDKETVSTNSGSQEISNIKDTYTFNENTQVVALDLLIRPNEYVNKTTIANAITIEQYYGDSVVSKKLDIEKK